MNSDLMLWWLYMFCVFISIFALFFATGEKKDVVRKAYKISFNFLVVFLALFMWVMYSFFPEVINSIIGAQHNLFQTELSYMFFIIGAFALSCVINKSDINHKTPISFIWGVYFTLVGIRHLKNLYANDYPFTWGGTGMGIPYLSGGLFLMVISALAQSLLNCKTY